MSGEPIRLLDDSSIREEIRLRLSREATVKPAYDFERGLARLRAAIANEAPGSEPTSEPPSNRLSVTNYAVKGSVWRLAGVVGLAATAAIVGLHAWGPATHVGRADAAGNAQAAAMAMPAAQNANEGESENLARIRAILATKPDAALQLVEEANARFPSGSLREEREVLAIDALRALGQPVESAIRARRFLQDFPKSSLSERVRQAAKL
jgi:hypothetical protein